MQAALDSEEHGLENASERGASTHAAVCVREPHIPCG